MSKYENLKKVIENVNELDEIYMKAKIYDKITRFGKAELRCSFCGRPQGKIQKLITHNDIYICEHCVAMMNSICEKEVKDYNKIKEEEQI